MTNKATTKIATPILIAGLLLVCVQTALSAPPSSTPMPWVSINKDNSGFILTGSEKTFVPWGVNYDHDDTGQARLIEDYWITEWSRVQQDFAEIKALGGNTVRIHLQAMQFITDQQLPNADNLKQLRKLIQLAEQQQLYLLITGLGFYHKADTPEWVDRLSEQRRWALQALFWRVIAATCRDSPAVFAYDLMNEPIIPSNRVGAQTEWLTGQFGGKFFVQRLVLDAAGRNSRDIARQWIDAMVTSIRSVDKKHLITIGVISQPAGKPLFYSEQAIANLDFVTIHLYPKTDNLQEAENILQKYSVGKPLVVSEIFPLKIDSKTLMKFINEHSGQVAGWYSFYWGKTRADYLKQAQDSSSPHSLYSYHIAEWLDLFEQQSERPGED